MYVSENPHPSNPDTTDAAEGRGYTRLISNKRKANRDRVPLKTRNEVEESHPSGSESGIYREDVNFTVRTLHDDRQESGAIHEFMIDPLNIENVHKEENENTTNFDFERKSKICENEWDVSVSGWKIEENFGTCQSEQNSSVVKETVFNAEEIDKQQQEENKEEKKIRITTVEKAIQYGEDEENENYCDGVKNQTSHKVNRSGSIRKTKSLGILNLRFLSAVCIQVDNTGCKELNLESIVRAMGVEKRRIYDVVNIYESLGAMQKSHKSIYNWKDFCDLPSTFHKLKLSAEKENIYEKVKDMQCSMIKFVERMKKSKKAVGKQLLTTSSEKVNVSCVTDLSQANISDCSSSFQDLNNSKQKEGNCHRGHNSLTHLCTNFCKVLISGLDREPNFQVSLDVLSTMLITPNERTDYRPPDRSRCRRIYDVANVLTSLRLVERRVRIFSSKKIPFFVYCGPKICEDEKFDIVQHLCVNKLSATLKYSEEKRAYEIEEKVLELHHQKRKKGESNGHDPESENDIEPSKQRMRTEAQAKAVQDNATTRHVMIMPKTENNTSGSAFVPVLRPQPQMFFLTVEHLPLFGVENLYFFQQIINSPTLISLNNPSQSVVSWNSPQYLTIPVYPKPPAQVVFHPNLDFNTGPYNAVMFPYYTLSPYVLQPSSVEGTGNAGEAPPVQQQPPIQTTVHSISSPFNIDSLLN
ncbi:unnamed protein product [Thelazia callipaeda]|uniref:E2F_TDP domain-containing protein n=1 Tax=Thelazia callipaeda TaxID=103827 RepID=A0A0N5D379_THECL|nr:unnamed protein product [Thelazia callipaeda]